MNEDETNANLPVATYDAEKTAHEIVLEITLKIAGKATQWEEEAALELTKAAGDRNLFNALTWAARQLHELNRDILNMSLMTYRFGYREPMFTADEVDAACAAAVEAYERNRPAEPFTPNPEVLNSNADPSGEAPEPGTAFVDNGNIAEVVEPGSDEDPFVGETEEDEIKAIHRAIVAGFVADDDFLDNVTDIRQYIIDNLDQADLDEFDTTVSATRKAKAAEAQV